MKKLFLALLLLPSIVFAYPNGTPLYVTDLVPACASCHSVVDAGTMPELPDNISKAEVMENKHYGAIVSGSMPYSELTDSQREALLKEVKEIDKNSSITIFAPERAKKGDVITIKVIAKGGNGPVIGVMLVDKPLRYQARPISSDGWLIEGEPIIVLGLDSTSQRDWLEKRQKGLSRNMNFILVSTKGIDSPTATIEYLIRAPQKEGRYSITAVLLYGTENSKGAGFFQRPSGRIVFSKEVNIVVK